MKKSLLVFLCMGAIAFSVSAGQPPDVTKTKTVKAELKNYCMDHSDLIYMAVEQEAISVPCAEVGTFEFVYIGFESMYMKPVSVSVNSPPVLRLPIFILPFTKSAFTINRKSLFGNSRWRQSKL